MSLEHTKDLFSTSFVAGQRTYFFNVKKSHEGVRYLVISESRRSGNGYEHDQVMVIEEHLDDFREAFWRVTDYLAGVAVDPTDKRAQCEKAYSVAEIRKNHGRAYAPWSPEEDERLRQSWSQGAGIEGLANEFQRKPGAIRSRLTRLGLSSVAEYREIEAS